MASMIDLARVSTRAWAGRAARRLPCYGSLGLDLIFAVDIPTQRMLGGNALQKIGGLDQGV